MTKGQLIAVIIAFVLAIAEVTFGYTVLHWNVDLVLTIAFLIIITVCGLGVFKINGMAMGKYLFLVFALADDVRLYSSEGGLNRGLDEKEKK